MLKENIKKSKKISVFFRNRLKEVIENILLKERTTNYPFFAVMKKINKKKYCLPLFSYLKFIEKMFKEKSL